MNDREQLLNMRGQTLVDTSGDKIGKIDEIYLDEETSQPEWAQVNIGVLGSRSSFVPLQSASISGDRVVVPFGKDQVKNAPDVAGGEELSVEQETELYRYYGLSSTQPPFGHGRSDGDGGRRDDAMTRSEEQVEIGTRQHETGRARLRKSVTTEHVTQTVPVTREEVRVQREPVTDANADEALSGPKLSEGEHEVTLHEEVPVVQKEVRPVERVRLDKTQVTDEQQVSEDIRKEQIDIDEDARRR